MNTSFAVMDFDASRSYYITFCIDCIAYFFPNINNFSFIPDERIGQIKFSTTCFLIDDALQFLHRNSDHAAPWNGCSKHMPRLFFRIDGKWVIAAFD